MVAATHMLQVAADPANWPALKAAKVGPALARLVGDHPKVASVAVQCLINLSADSEMQEQMLSLRLVTSIMEALKVSRRSAPPAGAAEPPPRGRRRVARRYPATRFRPPALPPARRTRHAPSAGTP